MVGWYHRLNGHEFGWTLGIGDGPYFHMETTSCLLIASLINKSLIFRHMAAGLTVTFLASFGGRSGYEVMLRG